VNVQQITRKKDRSYLKRASIGQLQNNLPRYLDHVRAGGEVIVLDRRRPIARIVPLVQDAANAGEDEDRLRRLEERGLLRRGTGRLPAWLGRRRPVRVSGSVLRDLLTEREEGR
jgi:antitoxin (DNA-binding transcriptional repressor) of toxin-antitoxin stability system